MNRLKISIVYADIADVAAELYYLECSEVSLGYNHSGVREDWRKESEERRGVSVFLQITIL